jgi:hypothetical protein
VIALGAGIHLRGSLRDAWKMIHIPANTYIFSDTGSLTYAIDGVLAGVDPYKVSPFDPLHRLYNYPPVWLMARYLGVNSHASDLVGVLLALAAVSAYLFLFNSRTLLSGVIVFLALTSHCVLFSIERGNTDQAVFFLLVFGFFLIHRQRPDLQSRLTSILLVFLTMLKIYPVAGVTVFLRNRRGWLRMICTAAAAVTALLITSGRYLAFVVANTPRDPNQSFGAFPFFYSLSRHTVLSLAPIIAEHRAIAPLAALVIGGLCLLVGAACGNSLHRALPPLDSIQARGAIAIACLSIFCFAFIAGSSYDYRLIYLTGVLAWLVEDMDQGHVRRSLPASLLLLILLWKPFWLSITGEMFDGLVFLMSSVWLGNTLFSREGARDQDFLPHTRSAERRIDPFAPPIRCIDASTSGIERDGLGARP